MKSQFKVEKGCPYPIGVSRGEHGINISMASYAGECGILLYDKNKKKLGKVVLSGEERVEGAARTGALCYAKLLWDGKEPLLYQFYEDGKVIFDSHMKEYRGHEKFGIAITPQDLYGVLQPVEYDWEDDSNPVLPYEDSVLYCMHVRGFTRHPSSGVEGKGTFHGVKEKLAYLETLGVTTLELLPVYELEEKKHSAGRVPECPTERETLNYWGYAEGLYYAPRNAYAMSGCGAVEFKDLIKALHKRKMEAVLQFYFPKDMCHGEILEILRYWKSEYHVDGFHLKGESLPLLMLGQEPGLTDTKLFYYGFPVDELYPGEKLPHFRNLAAYRDDYMYGMRRFLKGDEDMLHTVTGYMRRQPLKEGQINYFTNYYGFTLEDMVSYERKHNEDNGEDNRDGTDYNHTWNCGIEGKSRKKGILNLRRQQVRNALCMLFFSQGTPLVFMGDEFGNSQKGNNNPYCQDNGISWLNWKELEKNSELFEYVRRLIRIRKEHPVLHGERELRLMDYISCGYPDLSYHATKAWQPDMGNYSRHIGLMYCGKYARKERGVEDDFFYVAINMHWEPHEFALPLLPKEQEWCMLLDTGEWEITDNHERPLTDQQMAKVEARRIQVYISKKRKGKK